MSSLNVFRQLVGLTAMVAVSVTAGFAQPAPDILVASVHDSADMVSIDPGTSCAAALDKLEGKNLAMASVTAIPHEEGGRLVAGALYTFTSKTTFSLFRDGKYRSESRVVLLRCIITGLFEPIER